MSLKTEERWVETSKTSKNQERPLFL